MPSSFFSGLPGAIGAGLLGLVASIAQVRADDGELRLFVRSEPLQQVVETLSELAGTPITVAARLNGTVENWRVEGRPLEALQRLAKDQHFFFAYDGLRGLAAPLSSVSKVVLSIEPEVGARAPQIVRMLYPIYPDDAVQLESRLGTLVLIGPQEFLDVTRSALESPSKAASSEQIRIIRAGIVARDGADPR